MTTPRSWVHRGSRMCVGLWFADAWLDDSERRARVFAAARGQARVFDFGDGLLVRFAAPQRLDADHCPATPVVAADESLVTLPLERDELRALALAGPSLVRVRAGALVVSPLTTATEVDLSTWLDTDAWRVLIPQPPRVVGVRPSTAALEPGPKDARTILAVSIPEFARAREQLLADVDRRRSGAPAQRSWWGRLAYALAGTGAAQPALPAAKRPPVEIATTRPTRERGPLWRWLTDRVLGSPLARIIGRRHAAYLARNLDMFERGDFAEALRHAIPLSRHPAKDDDPPALGLLAPRDALRFSTGRATSRTGVVLHPESFAAVRATYLRAAAELERAGRIDEAAYVLVELLEDPHAAVNLLERHGRARLAAEIAEGRGLAPGLVIRLWFVAGDPTRAMAVARRTGAFADAVTRLERTHRDLGAELRMRWGEWLAAGGHFGAAAQAVSPVSRPAARRYLVQAVAIGGPASARLLPRLLLSGDDEDDRRDAEARIAEVIDDATADAPALRAELARVWTELPRGHASTRRVLGRRLLRQAMIDAACTGEVADVRTLAREIGDPALELEVARAPRPSNGRAQRSRSRRYNIDRRGLSMPLDAVVLERGRLLVALGEAGVRLVDRDGRALRHYEHPASELLLSDSGTRVVTLMRRDPERNTCTLGRIDLQSGRAERWCDAALDVTSEFHDGAHWYVAEGETVTCIDLHTAGFDALWQVGRLGGRVRAIAASPEGLAFVLEHREHGMGEVWRYALEHGVRRLDARIGFELGGGVGIRAASVDATGAVLVELDDASETIIGRPSYGPEHRARDPGFVAHRTTDTSALACVATDDGCAIGRVPLDSLAMGEPWLELVGVPTARLHRQGARWVVCDALGRVVALDDNGSIGHEWFV